MPDSKLDKRFVCDKGHVLTTHLASQGMKMATAAERTGVSLRTLSRISNGECVRLGTIVQIAEKLNVPVELFLGPKASEPEMQRVRIEMVLTGPKEILTVTRYLTDFIATLSKAIGAKHEIIPRYGEEGSVYLDVDMHVEDVDSLCRAFQSGTLAKMGFIAINLRYYIMNSAPEDYRTHRPQTDHKQTIRVRPYEFRGNPKGLYMSIGAGGLSGVILRAGMEVQDPAEVEESDE
jgi:transcriptional regulator with XRE-family HTH domain